MLTLTIFGSLAFNLARGGAIRSTRPRCSSCSTGGDGPLRARLEERTAMARSAASALGLVTLLTLPRRRRSSASPLASFGAGFRVLRARGTAATRAADREELAAYLRSVVPPGGRIYRRVQPARHHLFANDMILYFLADRLPGTPTTCSTQVSHDPTGAARDRREPHPEPRRLRRALLRVHPNARTEPELVSSGVHGPRRISGEPLRPRSPIGQRALVWRSGRRYL